MAFLSCLLLPAPALGLTLAQKLVTMFHLMDLSQLYTLLFCLWFLVLGAIEYFVLRFIWRRWFSLADLNVDYRRTSRHTLLILLRLKERLWISNHCTKRRNAWPLSYPLSSFAGLLARSSMFLKLAAKDLYAVVGAARRPLYQSEVRSTKSLLNQQIYPSIKPGYRMNKKHWISVYPGEEISEALLRDLIDDSWNLVVDGLAKRDQKRVRPG